MDKPLTILMGGLAMSFTVSAVIAMGMLTFAFNVTRPADWNGPANLVQSANEYDVQPALRVEHQRDLLVDQTVLCVSNVDGDAWHCNYKNPLTY